MSRRRDRWSAVFLPALARAQAKADRELAAAMRRLAAHDPSYVERRLGDAAPPGLLDLALSPAAHEETDREAGVLETATCYWVTAPMATVAMDASLDVPEIDVDRDIPSPSGFIAFEKPLPPLPLPQSLPEISASLHLPAASPVSALFWRGAGPGKLAITAFTWSGHLPAGSGIDDTAVPKQPLLEITTATVPRRRADLEDVEARPEVKSVLAFISATWVLMMTPTVAERKQLDPKTGGAPRPGVPDTVPMVTTIDLRPLRHGEKVTAEPGTGRVYKHRWVVRGHWRNQAHGSGRSQRRLTWIPSYLKGPEGAPIRASEKVMVWRR